MKKDEKKVKIDQSMVQALLADKLPKIEQYDDAEKLKTLLESETQRDLIPRVLKANSLLQANMILKEGRSKFSRDNNPSTLEMIKDIQAADTPEEGVTILKEAGKRYHQGKRVPFWKIIRSIYHNKYGLSINGVENQFKDICDSKYPRIQE